MSDTYYDATHTGLEIDEAVGKVLAPDATPTEDSTELITSGGVYTALGNKQATLVSGTNIKTVNSSSLLGSGDIAVQATLVSGTTIKTINSSSLLGSGNLAVQATLVSGTNIKTVNSTSLLGSGNVAVQATLVSGTNIKTVGGQTLLASGDVPVALPIVAQASIAWNTAHNFGTLSANKSVTLPALPSGVTGEIRLTATQGAGNSYKITLTAPTGVTITDGDSSGSSLEITPTAGKHIEISAAVVDTVISVLTNEV